MVGLVTPGGENVAPDNVLNRVDLPLPVPPASATTVWLPDSRSRSPALLSRASESLISALLTPLRPSRAWPILASSASLVQPDGRDRVQRAYPVKNRHEPQQLLIKQQLDALAEVRAGLGEQDVDLRRAEGPGEHLTRDLNDIRHRVAGDAVRGAVGGGVRGADAAITEYGDHGQQAERLAVRIEPAMAAGTRPVRGVLRLHQPHHVLLPRADRARGAVGELGRGPAEAVYRAFSGILGGRRRGARSCLGIRVGRAAIASGPLLASRPGCALRTEDGGVLALGLLTTGLAGLDFGQQRRPRGVGPPGGRHLLSRAVRDRGNERLDGSPQRRVQGGDPAVARSLAGSLALVGWPPGAERGTQIAAVGAILPPGQHLAAQQPRCLRPNVERRQRGGVLAFRQAAQPRPQGHLRVDVRGEFGDADLEGVKDAGHRLAEHRDSPGLPDRGLGEPVLDGLAHLFGQHIGGPPRLARPRSGLSSS